MQLSNQMRLHINAAAMTLVPGIRQSFVAGIMRALSHSTNPTLNDTLRAIQQGLAMIPASAVIISRSGSKNDTDTGDADDVRRRYY